jgi:hypothetical protein
VSSPTAPEPREWRRGRVVVGVLGGIAATFAMLVGAVSLTRIAGDYLGFPPGLEWTFTGAVDVAGIAGGIMWTAFAGPVRKIGRPMNIVCTIVSGVGVGLDHATHSGRALRDPSGNVALPGTADSWPWIAFATGLFVPALATWILHALSIIADTSASAGDADASARASGLAPADASECQPTLVKLGTSDDTSPRQAVIAAPVPARQTPAARPQPAAPPVARTTVAALKARPAGVSTRALEAVPSPRPEWLTDALLDEIVAGMRRAHDEGESYGRPRVMAEHNLNDGQAKAALRYIRDHRLLEAAS